MTQQKPQGSRFVCGGDRRSGAVLPVSAVTALLLLILVPGAFAFQTRTPVGVFGPAGPGACPGSTFATGTGDLSAASGEGDSTVFGTGNGSISEGSATITNVTTFTGAFTVGNPISGQGIPDGTTITAVGGNTLTLSQQADSGSTSGIISGSKFITNVTTSIGSFAVGWRIFGDGIPSGATITAVGADTLTLSTGVSFGSGYGHTGMAISAGSTEVANVATSCGAFAVGQSITGVGIRRETTVAAVGPNTLTLSNGVTASGTGVQLIGSSSFAGAGWLDFNQASDKLYVLDVPTGQPRPPAKIYAFDAPADSPVGGAFPLSTTGGDGVGVPSIAVDNTLGASAGNIYRVHPGVGGLIDGFNAAGAPLGGKFPFESSGNHANCGSVIDSAGNLWVADGGGFQALFKYDSAGNGPLQLAISQGKPCAPAFDSNDDLYVSISSQTPGQSGIWKLTAASGYKTATQITSSTASSLAIDRTTHTLYAVQNFEVVAYNLSGNQLYGFGAPDDGPRAVAVDESTDRVYVSIGDKVRVYGALAEFPDATATLQPATNVATTTAELHATIDDNSALPTEWRFQLSKDGGNTWTEDCFPKGSTQGGQSGLAAAVSCVNLQSGTPYLFRVITNKGGGSSDVASTTESFETVALPPASASCDPAANITATSADLSCTIDDNNEYPTNWRFQVSKDGVTWVDTKVSGVTKGNESGVVAAGTAKDLDPNTSYHFRIATSKGAGSVDTHFGDLTFTTLTAPPAVSSVGSYALTDTSAYLAGEVNPRNAATSYLFRYGTSPGSLDSETPATNIGSGLDDVIVAQSISGLNPDTDYYFKLVATNVAGPAESPVATLHTRAEPLPDSHPGSCANEALRQAQGATFLPDCRAYEMVTPPDKNFGDAAVASAPWVARDGQGVFLAMFTGFGDPPGQIGFIDTNYLSRRGSEGWRTRWLGEPECLASAVTEIVSTSPTLERVLIKHVERASCPIPPLDPTAPLDEDNLYLGDYTTDPPTYQLLTPQPGGYTGGAGAAVNDDLSHVVYLSGGQQTPDAPSGTESLFDWHGGTIDLISRDLANVPFATRSSTPISVPGTVSDAGDRIFFHNPTLTPTQELYMRQDDAVTYDVSQSECTSSCGDGAPDAFKRANPAGNKVLFTSGAKLTNDDSSTAGEDLYLYTHSANPAAQKNLTLLSKDSEPGDGTQADVLGVIGMSDDGETVFFVAKGQLAAGQPVAGGLKVYRWRRNGGSPSLDYLATLGVGGAPGGGEAGGWSSDGFSPRVTSDGAYLFLYTKVRLDPGADHDSSRDIYRWDSGAGWNCLSCQLPSLPSAGNSPFLEGAFGLGLAFSEDGQRAFFSSMDPLVPEDTNDHSDVYGWHDGRVSLISTGLGIENAELIGAGSNGDDVFFATNERLVGWDTDENRDIYDARVGGGFPEPSPEGAPCDLEAGACEGAPSTAPPTTGAGSAAFEGPGNPAPVSGCPKGKSRKHGRCVTKKPHHKKRQHKRAKHERRAAR